MLRTEWLSAKDKRLKQEEKAQSALQKTISKELEWLSRNAKGQQKKGAARLRRYDDLLADAASYVKDSQVCAWCNSACDGAWGEMGPLLLIS
jgi:ATPase subunit of ABC transporter with duplicated ATPase domains